MKPNTRLTLISCLAFLGVILTGIQTYDFLELRAGVAGFTSSCSIGPFDCQAIDASRYAELFAGIPLASLAMAAFLWIAWVAWRSRDVFWFREGVRALALLSGISVLAGVTYGGIQAFVLKKACLYCILVDTLIVLITVLVLSLKPEGFSKHRPDRTRWKTLGLFGLLSAAAALIVQASMRPTIALPNLNEDTWVQDILQTPALPVDTSGSAAVGPESAPITIVKFSDFQCPSCKRGALLLHPLLKRFPGQIRVVFKHFPLDMSCNRAIQRPAHPWACLVAKAAECFRQKGQFEAAYQAFFESQEKLNAEWVRKFAERSGWSADEFQKCLDDTGILDRVRRDVEQGLSLNVESTPTFFINGHKQEGVYNLESWSKLIERLLLPTSSSVRSPAP